MCIHADDDDADDADDDDDDDDGHDGRGGGDVRGDNDPDELDDGCLGALTQRQPLPRAALTIVIQKSIPGVMKTMNFIFKILENHAWDDKYNDFGSFWMV